MVSMITKTEISSGEVVDLIRGFIHEKILRENDVFVPPEAFNVGGITTHTISITWDPNLEIRHGAQEAADLDDSSRIIEKIKQKKRENEMRERARRDNQCGT